MPQAELELQNVTIRFGGVTVVNNVSMTVGTRDLVGFVGPNGGGQDHVVHNAISGLVRPTQGTIRFDGADILKTSLHKRARLGIGRTFQVPQPLHELTVRENLIVAQRFGAGRVDEARIDEILGFLRLQDKADRNAATELALTELKALEVAKSLATQPKLLFADGPPAEVFRDPAVVKSYTGEVVDA
ncbi:MAG: Branched-chain amino acid ABC transporter, ATP-binding protein LivG (TC 3.A.1.4.1) [uncultured Caballeronia sp.]|nr:MAG: Branched-chain amino acid ABC transporter, ATP-binding protein LivG (TC 3.A.1.4.1) [uncultured Caballeronia sp.]